MKSLVLGLLIVVFSVIFGFSTTWQQIYQTTPNQSTAIFTFTTNGVPMLLVQGSSITDELTAMIAGNASASTPWLTNASISVSNTREPRAFLINNMNFVGYWDASTGYKLTIWQFLSTNTNTGAWVLFNTNMTYNAGANWSMDQDTNSNIVVAYSDPILKTVAVKALANTNFSLFSNISLGLPSGIPIHYTDLKYYAPGKYHFLSFQQLRVNFVAQTYAANDGGNTWYNQGYQGWYPLEMNLSMAPQPTIGFINYTNFTYLPFVATYNPGSTNWYTNTSFSLTNVNTNVIWSWLKKGVFNIPNTSQYYEMSMAKDFTNNLYVALLNSSYLLSVYEFTNGQSLTSSWTKLTNSGLPGTAMRNIQLKVNINGNPYILYQSPLGSKTNSFTLVTLQ